MNQYPQDPNHLERQQALREEEEAFRLHQEERRLELARRTATLVWMTRSIAYLIAALEILLGLRFLLRVLGANTENSFAQFIYNLSDPFVAPFSTLFISPTAAEGSNIFDVNVLIAMVVYALLGWLAIRLVQFMQGR